MHEYNENLLKERREMIDKVQAEILEARNFIDENEKIIKGLEEANEELEKVFVKK